jgi:hypothetical protein
LRLPPQAATLPRKAVGAEGAPPAPPPSKNNTDLRPYYFSLQSFFFTGFLNPLRCAFLMIAG